MVTETLEVRQVRKTRMGGTRMWREMGGGSKVWNKVEWRGIRSAWGVYGDIGGEGR